MPQLPAPTSAEDDAGTIAKATATKTRPAIRPSMTLLGAQERLWGTGPRLRSHGTTRTQAVRSTDERRGTRSGSRESDRRVPGAARGVAHQDHAGPVLVHARDPVYAARDHLGGGHAR